MKKAFVVLAVFVASCSPKIMTLTQTDADRGATKFPGLTVEELKRGKAVYDEKCTMCHGAKKTSAFTEDQWRKIVPGMAKKANKDGTEHISIADQGIILKYVITMGKASK